MSFPLVSVCIPVYNAEKYIEQCAQSLFEQTLDDLEYIFIDDSSTDRSYEKLISVLAKYPARKSQVKIVRHAVNEGVSCSRMEAVRSASGKYIIHCDSDDWVEPNIYEVLYNRAEKESADMAYCSFSHDRSDQEKQIFREKQYSHPYEMINAFFIAQSHCSLWNKLYRKEIAQDETLSLPKEINMCEDLRLNVQMLLKCKKITCCPAPLYHYRINPQSLTTGLRNQQSFQSEIKNVELYEKLLPDEIFGKNLDAYKRRTLMEGCMLSAIPAKQWHSLWKRAKYGIFKSHYPWKLKTVFCVACINYSFASWIWRKMRERHHR